MAVSFNAVTAPPTTSVTTNPVAVTLTASGAGGTNGYVVVIVHARAASATLSCTINGVAATAIGNAVATSVSLYVFGAPVGAVTAGQNIAVSVANSGAVALRVGTLLYTGASQSATPSAVADGSLATTPNTTTAISANSGGMAVSALSNGTAVSPTATLATGSGTLTQRWSSSGGTGGNTLGEGAYDDAASGTGNVQFSWTSSTSGHCIVTLVIPSFAATLLPGQARGRHLAARSPSPARGRF